MTRELDSPIIHFENGKVNLLGNYDLFFPLFFENIELFEKYQTVQIDFNLENIKSITSGLNAVLFNKYNLKFEIMYFNKKFKYQHDDIDYITMQIYNKLFQYHYL